MRRRVGLRVMVLALFLVVLGTTSSAAPQPGRVHFTAAGDFASTPNTTAVLNAIHDSGSDFTLAVGDLSYAQTGQEQAWCDYVTPKVGAGYPFELISGNHESEGTLNGNINDFSACLPNQLPGAIGTYGRQYYVDVPADDPIVRYLMISPGLVYPDGTWSYASTTARYAWVSSTIDGARAAGIPWVVVGMHKPCITVGRYPCDSGSELFNLLLSKKVDLVLSGHEHSYQRSHQLALGPGCSTLTPGAYNAACVKDSDSSFVAGAGTVAAVVGTGGQAGYDVNDSDPEAPYFAVTSGLNKNMTWGPLDVTATDTSLQASFLRASGGTVSDSFSLTKQATPPNTPPVAAFTSSCTELACSFNASASNDPDGTIASYAWNFGDGTTGTGVNPSHSYPAADTYTVQLTITDNGGATGGISKTIATTAPPVTAYASDAFARTVAAGWGTAPTGGAYTLSGGSANFAVADGVGTIKVAAGTGPAAFLTGVSAASTDLQFTLTTDKPATGSGLYVSGYARRIVGQGGYVGKAKILSTGAVAVEIDRIAANGVETVLQAASVVPGLSYAAGDQLQVRVQAVGTAPTLLRAKVWKVGSAEPAAWQRSITDTTAGLQGAGHVGVSPYLSSTATNAPITLKIDNLVATAP